MSQDGRCEADIKRRIGLTYAVFNKLANIWNCNRLAMGIKVQVYKAMVLPVLIYGSKSWTMRKQDENRVLVAEMSWLRKISGISRLQHIRNEEIRKITGNEETAVDKIKTRRLRWFGHVSQMDINQIGRASCRERV